MPDYVSDLFYSLVVSPRVSAIVTFVPRLARGFLGHENRRLNQQKAV